MEQIPLLLFLTADVALGFLAAAGPRGTSLAAAVTALGALVGHPSVRLLLAESVSATAELADAMSVAVAWLIGNTVRQARDHTRTSRAQTAAQAVTAERLRIARELHDLVAHNIGIIALQAGAARMVINIDPPSASEAMTAVEAAGRETLAGLRRMLGALRQAEPDDHSGPRHWGRHQAWRMSNGWPRRQPRPASGSKCGGWASGDQSLRRSTSRPSGSSRSRSPT
ncbi:histidine kinase dimerization/phosphoacceptor domain-containing protein [Kitasatospora sp. NPDC017646]|uniref:histidine kinase dimerization/phosphoacceptor domain-containing protein n=1 Tax=Kitasatospora sp. NPDC017646 TaxID=3364024 RepID=UPI00378C1CD7